MVISIYDALRGLYDKYAEISVTDLKILQDLVSGDLARLNPGFTDNDLVELEAYLIIYKYESRSSDENIKSEKIKDHSWTYHDSSSATKWMDMALKKIATYNQTGAEYGCVERVDSEMASMAADMIEIERFYEA